MAQLSDVLLQGLRSAQPLATAVANGTLYYVTDEQVLEQSDATVWSPYSGVPATAGLLLMASVTVTNAQIITLPTAPITLVAAPGAGFRLVPLTATIYGDFAAGAYTGMAAAYSDLRIETTYPVYWSYVAANDNSLTTPLTGMNSFLGIAHTAMIDAITMYNVVQSNLALGSSQYNVPQIFGDVAVWEDKGLQLAADNGGVNFGGGNVANSMVVRVYYMLQAVP